MKHSRSLPGISLALILFLFTLTGCYPRYYGPPPVSFNPAPSIQSGNDGVRVTVIPSLWTGTPRNLPRFVTPFYVEIENFSNNPLSVSYQDIVLFDQFRTQYSPLNPETVADMLSTSDFNYAAAYPAYPNISIGIGGGYGGFYRGWGPWGYGSFYRPFGYYAFSPGWYYPPPVYYYPVPVSTKDVVTGALMPGTIHPNASLKGYVYFKNLPAEVSQVTLNVGYVNGGSQEFQSLSFPFSAVAGGY